MFHSSPTTLGGLFNDARMIIPHYQRDYSWEKPNLEDLINDLDAISDTPHFTGQIVVTRFQQEPTKIIDGSSYDQWEVIDGQQRLTTLVVLLKALYDRLASMDTPSEPNQQVMRIRSEIQDEFLFRQDFSENICVPKLQLNPLSDPYFRRAILELSPNGLGAESTTRGHRLLAEAKKFFERCLENKSFGEVRVLYNKARTQLLFNLCTFDPNCVGMIFETMNNRGVPLLSLDKIKNYLMYLSRICHGQHAASVIDDINKAWSEILPRLEFVGDRIREADEEQFIRFALFVSFGYTQYQEAGSDAYRVVKRNVDADAVRSANTQHTLLVPFADRLAKMAELYQALYLPETCVWMNGNHREHLRKFERLNRRASFLPLWMGFCLKFRSSSDFDQDLLELLRACEVFCFRVYFVGEYRSDNSWAMLQGLAHDVYADRASASEAIDRIKRKTTELCDDASFEQALRRKVYGWKGLAYFLFERELALLSQNYPRAQIDWEKVKNENESVEHILPRTGTPYWEEIFQGSSYEDNLHGLGNLTLTTANSLLSNRSYPEKLAIFSGKDPRRADVPLAVEREVGEEFPNWDAASIGRRTEELSKWAVQRWKI